MSKINNTAKIISLFLLNLLCFFAANQTIKAAAGDLDTNFAATPFALRSELYSMAVQPDGKILIGGTGFDIASGFSATRLARLNADGSFDETFNVGGAGANALIWQIRVLPDGKILIAGDFTTYNGTTRGHIARLNADGTLDTTFAPPGFGFSDDVYELAVQTDGKIVVGGNFTTFNGTSRVKLARLNSDGTLDTAFNPGTGATGTSANVAGLAIQTDGNIIISGRFTGYNGTPSNRIARIIGSGANAGQLDTTFVVGTGANEGVFEVIIDSSGGIIISGIFTSFNGNPAQRIARLTSTGAFDVTFNAAIGASANNGGNNYITSLKIDLSGMIYVAGEFSVFGGVTHNRLVRLFPGGTIDTSYNPSVTGGIASVAIQSIALQTDGKAVIVGDFFALTGNEVRLNLARVNTDGTNDNTFDGAPGNSATSLANVNVVVAKPDGKLVVAGGFEIAGRYAKRRIAQLNADGSIDTTFISNPTNSGANGEIYALAIQTDGKILIGGIFTDYNGSSRNRIARLNADGTLDTTFNVGTGAGGTGASVNTIAVQADGKILIGGNFTTYNGTSRSRIARLNSDGTLDTLFVAPTASAVITSIFIQPDNKILVGGNFANFDSTGINRLVRLESNGVRDVNFNVGGAGANNFILRVKLEDSGSILLSGNFTNYNGTFRGGIARVNSDGSLAASIGELSGGAGAAYDITIQPDGKIIAVGDFTSCSGISRLNVCRYNTDGTFDTSFNGLSAGTNARVNVVILRTSGEILIGGFFSTYKGAVRRHLAQIVPGETITWNGSSNTNWNNAANWTPAQVPTISDAVMIPTGVLAFEPTLNASITHQNLIIQTGRTVTVPTGLTLTAGALINSGTITGAGTFSLTSSATNNGTISTLTANTSGGNTKYIGGNGAFLNNTFSIIGTLYLTSNHQFSTLKNVSGNLLLQTFTLRLSGAGDALDPGAGANFGCASCTIEYNGTTTQTVQNVPGNYRFLVFNNPNGVSLTENVSVNNSAELTNGTISTGAFELKIVENATLSRTNGWVIGKLSKRFINGGENFTFHTGTANGYSPVGFNVVNTGGSNKSVTIQTFQTNQPNLNAATSLARYWQITADSNITANIVFNYLNTDVIGSEANYRIFKIESGMPTGFPNDCANVSPCVDTTNNTATINNVTQFSDWTVGQLAPLAAEVSVGGRVTANGRGIGKATVTLTDANGESRFATTNAFGYYRFDNVEVGQTCVISIRHKQFEFASQIINVSEEMFDVNFTLEQNK